MRILSVDDNAENRHLIEAILRGNGYEVQSAVNGAEAFAQLQSGEFDLIISDILMPVMDGYQLCQKVKEDERLRSIPFIFYTSTYTSYQDEVFALKLGADRFIRKPCELKVFMETVRDVMAAAKEGGIASSSHPPQEEEVLKLYNERLVYKLEEKMLEIEKEVETRQKAEEILKQSETKYRSLYHSIRDAIVVTDTNMTIIDCNQAFVDLFGYSLPEIAGAKTRTIFANEEEYHQLAVALKDHLNDPNFLTIINFKKKDGSAFPGEANIYCLRNDEGTLTGFIGLVRDITERVHAQRNQKDLEAQLQQA